MVHVIPGRLSILRIPVRTFFNGLGQGCIAVAMSHDAQYVATVSMAVPQVQLYHGPLHTRMNIICVVCRWCVCGTGPLGQTIHCARPHLTPTLDSRSVEVHFIHQNFWSSHNVIQAHTHMYYILIPLSLCALFRRSWCLTRRTPPSLSATARTQWCSTHG